MRKVLFVTGTRAEYGLMKTTLNKIKESSFLELFIVVTGAHLTDKYGNTAKEIEADGFKIAANIPAPIITNENIRIPSEMGSLMKELGIIMEKIKPDFLLVLGDRYEMLATTSVAVGMNVPIAHISGGEITEGAIDDQIRHAITKMAHIHFPGASEYADNIKKMGEESWRIYDVGDPGIENIKQVNILKKEELEESLNIKITEKTLLVTYHPVTLEIDKLEEQIANLIMALKAHMGTKIITYPNFDEGNRIIISKLKKYAKEDCSVCLVKSLGIDKYLSVMKYCGAVVGNSSSAIVEAPFMKVPAVNIGNRQKGRLMAGSIICCDYTKEAICASIKKALSPEFREIVHEVKSLYGEGNTSDEIVKVLETIELGEHLLKKKLVWD